MFPKVTLTDAIIMVYSLCLKNNGNEGRFQPQIKTRFIRFFIATQQITTNLAT